MAVKIWNTRKLMFFGAIGGAICSWLTGPRTELSAAGSDAFIGAIAEVLGGAIGGAILLAVISGVRNLLARKKKSDVRRAITHRCENSDAREN